MSTCSCEGRGVLTYEMESTKEGEQLDPQLDYVLSEKKRYRSEGASDFRNAEQAATANGAMSAIPDVDRRLIPRTPGFSFSDLKAPNESMRYM